MPQLIKIGNTIYKVGNTIFSNNRNMQYVGVTSFINGFSSPAGCAIDPNSDRMFVQNTANNTVSIVKRSDLTAATPSVITQSQGSFNFSGNNYGGNAIAVDNINNKIYVANRGNSTLSILSLSDPTAGSPVVISTSQGGFSGPMGVGVDHARGFLYVVNNSSNSVSVLPLADPESGGLPSIGASIASLSAPTSIAVDAITGQLFIGNISSNSVSILPSPYENANLITGFTNTNCVMLDQSNNRIYVINFRTFGQIVYISYSDPTANALGIVSPIGFPSNGASNGGCIDSYYNRIIVTGSLCGQLAILQNIFS